MSFRLKLVLFVVAIVVVPMVAVGVLVTQIGRSLTALADEALYRAKREGKNRVVAAGRGGVALPGAIGA